MNLMQILNQITVVSFLIATREKLAGIGAICYKTRNSSKITCGELGTSDKHQNQPYFFKEK